MRYCYKACKPAECVEGASEVRGDGRASKRGAYTGWGAGLERYVGWLCRVELLERGDGEMEMMSVVENGWAGQHGGEGTCQGGVHAGSDQEATCMGHGKRKTGPSHQHDPACDEPVSRSKITTATRIRRDAIVSWMASPSCRFHPDLTVGTRFVQVEHNPAPKYERRAPGL